jgi:DNA-binding SARP family transcriptional activator/tetratricopeptide (TPR) repeat protein
MDGLELGILGPLEVRRDGVPVPVPAARQRSLLAALALRANRLVTVEQLIEVLWGDDPPPTARNTLQTLVRRLRRRLATSPEQGARVIQGRPGGYLLAAEPDRVDAYRFEAGLRRGRDALAGGDPAGAVRLLAVALHGWRGEALADVTSDALRAVEQPRLEELRRQAVEEHAEARLRCGEHAALVVELRAMVAEQPLRERPYEQLMVALYRAGRRADALAVYRTLRERLAGQLGVEPGRPSQRLHQAILRGDATLDPPEAAEPPPSVPAQLPAEIAGFTGRTAELAELARLRAAEDPPVTVTAIVGTAGVGKTALALRWAHRLREQFPDGQLYLDLGGFSGAPPIRPVDALGQFLRALGVAAHRVPADAQEAAGRYRSLLADRRVLVVLDNAGNADQVRPLLPGGPGCLAVVTSRDRLDSLVVHEGAARLRLEPLPPDEAQALLARGIGADRAAADPGSVAELARLCAHLPLALRIAAANLAAGRTGLAGYLAQLRAGRLDRLSVAGGGQAAVRATFDLSYAALADPARRLFRLLGCVPGVELTVPAAAALAGADPLAAGRALDELAAAHLLSELAPGRFGTHDLLRDYAAGLAGGMPAGDREAARAALTGWYLAGAGAAASRIHPDRLRLPGAGDRLDRPSAAGVSPEWDQPAQAVAWLDAERGNLVLLARHAADHGPAPAAWQLASTLRAYLAQGGHAAELRAIARAGLAAAEPAGDLTGQAAARLSLGTGQLAQQRYPAAIEQFQQAAGLAGAAGWDEGAAVALTNLATAYQGAGRRAEAAEQYAAALALHERLGRPDRQAAVLCNLGNTRWELGELDRAADHLTRALELFRVHGSRAWQAIALNNLGIVRLEQGRPDTSLAHLTEALAINQEIGNRVSEAGTIRALADVHRDAGRTGPALELAETAVQLARELQHRALEAAALNSLAAVHRRDGRPDRAQAPDRDALALVRRTAQPHLEAQIQLSLAATYRALDQPDLASSHAGQALTIARTHDYRWLARQAASALSAPVS